MSSSDSVRPESSFLKSVDRLRVLRSRSGKLNVPIGEPKGAVESASPLALPLEARVAQSNREFSNQRDGELCRSESLELRNRVRACGDIEKLSDDETSREFKSWNVVSELVGSVVREDDPALLTLDERNRYLKNRPASLLLEELGTL